ncbi:MAG: amidohydrolase family protein [Dehalococcoidia bacterium]
MSYRIISADCHLDMNWLPPDTFTARAPASMKDRVPHVEETSEGIKYWFVKGKQMWGSRVGWYGPGVNGGKRGELLVKEGFTKGDLRCSDYQMRKADQVRDGVDAEVVYGILAVDRSIPDKPVLEATYKAYNDFVSEWQQHDTDWLIPLAEIPNHDGTVAAEEVCRAKEIGLRGAEFAPATMAKPLWDDEWVPLWEAVEDTQLSLSFHAFNISTTFSESEHPAAAGANLVLAPSRADEVLCTLVLSGLLERHPRAKMILGESGIGWIPYMLERLDYSYDRRLGDLNLPLMPSEYFKRQVYATYIQDYWGTKAMWELGYLDNIMWSTDYPHRDSTWPESKENVEKTFGGLPEEVKKACVHDNVVRIYGLSE